ncbi:AraC family transcriptional regulator [uncultured Dubosiella sp.]|uniref:AraC family transcriptional regulator n=1 Tax=uncultured Dubosiella sp. TaxID=1937011 RepID=UPI0025B55284|nr:AraC family transcriptional regulator [uncultured Dubosiella sp.]
MDLVALEQYLKSDHAVRHESSEKIWNHFKEKYVSVPYNGKTLFIFNHEREFANKNHKVELHFRGNGVVPFHIYHYIVMTYCYSGQMTIAVDKDVIVLKQGDMIIFDRHVPHQVEKCSMDDLGINIILSDSYFRMRPMTKLPKQRAFQQFMIEMMSRQQTHTHYFVVHTHEDPLTKMCIDHILCESIDPQMGSEDIVDSLILVLLTHLARKEESQTNLELSEHKNQDLIDDILAYIKSNYQKGNLNEMCSHFGYEASYASRMIKKHTGKTFKELVNEERMKRAMVLLKDPDIPISDIAVEVGINNLTMFYKRFEAYSGMTPGKYRQE